MIHNRRIELTQLRGHDIPIHDTELYLSIVEHDDKGRTYGLVGTPSGPRRRHVGAGSSCDI
ncbi:hypothetical protein Scep_026368 [Stephania cephalantha]|uniref:Uncharacterized protein n=1 Tax=Stephania cephalantha TaxID=152367 RepID=A0AAP0ETW0_9MAGN